MYLVLGIGGSGEVVLVGYYNKLEKAIAKRDTIRRLGPYHDAWVVKAETLD